MLRLVGLRQLSLYFLHPHLVPGWVGDDGHHGAVQGAGGEADGDIVGGREAGLDLVILLVREAATAPLHICPVGGETLGSLGSVIEISPQHVDLIFVRVGNVGRAGGRRGWRGPAGVGGRGRG